MEPVSVSQLLAALFEAHGVEFVVHEGWVAPGGRLPAIRATWYPRGKTGRLDVDVLLEDDNRHFQEAFAGVGEGEAGLRDAWENFCRNSFHVLLSALWGPDLGACESDMVSDDTEPGHVSRHLSHTFP